MIAIALACTLTAIAIRASYLKTNDWGRNAKGILYVTDMIVMSLGVVCLVTALFMQG